MSRPVLRKTCAGLAFGIATAAASSVWANPDLPLGVWQEITPSVITTGAPETCIGQGIAIDLQDPATIYWGNTPYNDSDGGLFKTTDAGSTWTRVASVTPVWQGATDHLDMPLHMRIDPNDSNHLYAGDGVRGSSTGFFVSTDGGASFVKPQGFIDAHTDAEINTDDIYDVAVDPVDFDHVLISFHSAWGWTETKWNTNAGVMESTDGGDTWKIHEPLAGWGAGHAIKFLYVPALGIGDSNTWLLGTQGAGFWRTTDAGGTWTQVSTTSITHGGAAIYYTADGTLYTAGLQSMRSTDNGEHWSDVGPGGTWAVYGDGTTLYTGKSFGANQPFQVSPESDGATWTNFDSTNFSDGPYEMAYDSTNGIMYSSNWSTGVWALKVGEGTGVIPGPSGGSGGASTGGSGNGGSMTGGSGGSGLGGSGGSAGAVALGGSAGSTAGGAGQAGSNAAAPSNADAGCSCHTVGTGDHGGNAGLWASALLVGVALRRRRRTAA